MHLITCDIIIFMYTNTNSVFVSCCVLCLIYFHRTFQSLVNIWRYAGLLLATLLNMMMSFPLKLAQTYTSYCKTAVDGNLIIDTNINVFTILLAQIITKNNLLIYHFSGAREC